MTWRLGDLGLGDLELGDLKVGDLGLGTRGRGTWDVTRGDAETRGLGDAGKRGLREVRHVHQNVWTRGRGT